MIELILDKNLAVVHVRPTGPMRKEDFDSLAQTVDPFIEQTGCLKGLLLEVARFPGWEDIGAVARHIRFVSDHHSKIKKLAVVTDSLMGEATEHIPSHFVAAEIRHFRADQVHQAKEWLATL